MKRECKYNIVDVDYVKCPYCNKELQMLHWSHLKKLHNKTVDEMNKEFPGIPSMTKKESDNRSRARLLCNEKINQTCKEKYGGVGLASKVLTKKFSNGMFKNHGVYHPMKDELILKKWKSRIFTESGEYTESYKKRNEKIAKAHKGQPSKLKGRKYKEIHGEKRANELIEDKRISGAISCSLVKNPSKPQVELYKLVKEIYDEAKINYCISIFNVDICIPSLRIIIEYDGSYWHQDKNKDISRQEYLEKLGWKFIRYIDYSPSKEQVIEDIKKLI